MKVKFEPVSKFPAVRRDLALLLDKDISFEALKSTAMKSEKKLLQKVDLFDVYEGNKLPKGKKSYALSFILRNDDKTLVDKQVDKVMDKILKEFTAKHGAELRA
jgi:phenylalanyl-tRNA synthetase beta chain